MPFVRDPRRSLTNDVTSAEVNVLFFKAWDTFTEIVGLSENLKPRALPNVNVLIARSLE